jgi:hypothetical protein
MAPHGYTWYHLRGEDDPEPVDSLDGDPGYGDLMYLLAPEPVDAGFWELSRAWRAALEAAHAAADAEPPAGSGTPADGPADAPAATSVRLPDDRPALRGA